MKKVSMEEVKKVGKSTVAVLGGLLTVVQLKNELTKRKQRSKEDMILNVVEKYRLKIEKLLDKKVDLRNVDSYKKVKKLELFNEKIDMKIEKLRGDLQYEIDLINKVMG